MDWTFYENAFLEAFGQQPPIREVLERRRTGDPSDEGEFRRLFVFQDEDAGNFARFQAKFNMVVAGSELGCLYPGRFVVLSRGHRGLPVHAPDSGEAAKGEHRLRRAADDPAPQVHSDRGSRVIAGHAGYLCRVRGFGHPAPPGHQPSQERSLAPLGGGPGSRPRVPTGTC